MRPLGRILRRTLSVRPSRYRCHRSPKFFYFGCSLARRSKVNKGRISYGHLGRTDSCYYYYYYHHHHHHDDISSSSIMKYRLIRCFFAVVNIQMITPASLLMSDVTDYPHHRWLICSRVLRLAPRPTKLETINLKTVSYRR